jgi:hypothetical protein
MTSAASDRASTDLVASLLTVIVCSSPVPSNPETLTIRAVFRSLRLAPGLTSCAKIIQFDGPQAALPAKRVNAYNEFKQRVRALSAGDEDFARSQVFASETFLFAAHNLAAAIQHVNTSLLLSLQHDYEIARPFDVPNLVRLTAVSNTPAIATITLRSCVGPVQRTARAPHSTSAAHGHLRAQLTCRATVCRCARWWRCRIA